MGTNKGKGWEAWGAFNPTISGALVEVIEKKRPGSATFAPEKVIFNDPATVVYWKDGTKTVVRCHEGDEFDKRTGFLLCCAKRLMGNTGKFNDAMLEHCGASDD